MRRVWQGLLVTLLLSMSPVQALVVVPVQQAAPAVGTSDAIVLQESPAQAQAANLVRPAAAGTGRLSPLEVWAMLLASAAFTIMVWRAGRSRRPGL